MLLISYTKSFFLLAPSRMCRQLSQKLSLDASAFSPSSDHPTRVIQVGNSITLFQASRKCRLTYQRLVLSNVVGRKIYRRISVPQNHAPLQDHQLNAKVFDKDVSRASLVHKSTSYDIIVLMDFVLFSSGGKDCTQPSDPTHV
jgi:hypothetical protein